MDTRGLWASPDRCCGCGACAARCPRGAIRLREGADGFVFPEVNESLCVDCGLCKRVCGLQNARALQTSGPWYAASLRGDSSLSASGGAFFALARAVVSMGGVVFGAAYMRDDGRLSVRHVMTEDEAGLSSLQGSKYVQSDAGACFPEVERELRAGREVLFSGTPCQVAGLKGYLGRDWTNLVTVDLVCHGVPSEVMFHGLVAALERRYGKRVVDLRFRCKHGGWGHSMLLVRLRPFGETSTCDDEDVQIQASDFTYYDLFLRRMILRDSCYACPFASPIRPGDLTVGDFWGVEDNRPDVLLDGRFDVERGISCLLVNNMHGREALERFGRDLDLCEVEFEDIAKGNDQLRHPSTKPTDRELYLTTFRDGDWNSVEALWRRRERGVRYRVREAAKRVLPKGVRRFFKHLISR